MPNEYIRSFLSFSFVRIYSCVFLLSAPFPSPPLAPVSLPTSAHRKSLPRRQLSAGGTADWLRRKRVISARCSKSIFAPVKWCLWYSWHLHFRFTRPSISFLFFSLRVASLNVLFDSLNRLATRFLAQTFFNKSMYASTRYSVPRSLSLRARVLQVVSMWKVFLHKDSGLAGGR